MYVIYDAAKNPTQATLPGVPLDNMSEAEFKALPAWLRHSVCGCVFYNVPDEACEAARLEVDPPKPEEPPAPEPPQQPAIQIDDEVINHE